MSDNMVELNEDDLPTLDTEEGREVWAEILLQQDDETLAAAGQGWVKALVVSDDDGNMVVRFVYAEGVEEVYDLKIQRLLADIDLTKGEAN